MTLKNTISKCFLLLLFLIIYPKTKAAETIYLYKGNFNRTILVKELSNFEETKIPSAKLKKLMYITNLNNKQLLEALTLKIEVPLIVSSKLMNSTIGEVLLGRIAKIIHPNKILKKELSIKAIRSAIIISSYNNNQKINLIDFFKAYPNKNIGLNLNALNTTLEKIESLTDLIEFYSNSPLKKLKDGSSST